MSEATVPILAFLPLRWAAIPTSKRHELAQLAKTRSVFVLETPEPVDAGARECWELLPGAPDLLICRPRVARSAEVADPGVQTRMLKALLHWLDIDDFVTWHYAQSLLIHDRSLEPGPREKTKRAKIALAPPAAAEPSGAA